MGSFGDFNRIGANISALQALNSLNRVNSQLGVHNLRLSTGKRINSAADDAAGMFIGRTLQARNKGLMSAVSNIGDARSLLSVAEGGLGNILDILESMKEKVTQAASDTLGSSERNAIEDELDAMAAEIDDIVDETTFNGVSLLTSVVKTIQAGAETTDTLVVTITTQSHTAGALSVADANVSVNTAANSSTSLGNINTALNTVKTSIAKIGAFQNRLSVKESTLDIAITNTEASRSRIMDADIAREQLESLKLQILQQTATASLAQANAAPQVLLSLFG